MFIAIYKSTIKNLLRSVTFWLTLSVLLIVVMQGSIEGFYLGDDDPAFTLSYQSYIQCIGNALISTIMMFAMPLFSIVSVILVLNRDFGDNFFEIEKAANIKPLKYLLSRLFALVCVNFAVLLIMNYLCTYWYIFTRGGVEELTTTQMIFETIIRVLRADTFVGMPTLIFYIGFTYFVGSLFKNGIPAAITSMAYAICFYAGYLRLRFQIPEGYFDYFSPIPQKLHLYFHYYDTEWFEHTLTQYRTSLKDAFLCITFLVGIATLFSILSFLNVKKRTV